MNHHRLRDLYPLRRDIPPLHRNPHNGFLHDRLRTILILILHPGNHHRHHHSRRRRHHQEAQPPFGATCTAVKRSRGTGFQSNGSWRSSDTRLTADLF